MKNEPYLPGKDVVGAAPGQVRAPHPAGDGGSGAAAEKVLLAPGLAEKWGGPHRRWATPQQGFAPLGCQQSGQGHPAAPAPALRPGRRLLNQDRVSALVIRLLQAEAAAHPVHSLFHDVRTFENRHNSSTGAQNYSHAFTP